jgi:hypothetical protein
MNKQTFELIVVLSFIIWMTGVVTLFVLLLKRYTFGKWDNENQNPHAGETLSIPRGFFRGTLTLSLLFFVILFYIGDFYFEYGSGKLGELTTAFEMMLAFYFGAKVMHHLASNDKNKTKAIVENMKKTNNRLPLVPANNDFEDEESVG